MARNTESKELSDDVRFAEARLHQGRTAAEQGDSAAADAFFWDARYESPMLQAAQARIELVLLRVDHPELSVDDGSLRPTDLLLEAEQIAARLAESPMNAPSDEPVDGNSFSESTVRLAQLRVELANAFSAIQEIESAAHSCYEAIRLLRVGGALSPDGQMKTSAPILSPDVRHLAACAYFQLGELADLREPPGVPGYYFEAARNLRDVRVSPFAAIRLAEKSELPATREWMLREAMGYDHPEASPQAAFALAQLLHLRGQVSETRNLLREIVERSGNLIWSTRASEVLEALPKWVDVAPELSWIGAEDYAEFELREPPEDDARKVLIVGAGTGGQYLLHSLGRDQFAARRKRIIGFVDDRAYPDGVPYAEGLKVFGTLEDLESVLRTQKPDLVWLAMPTAPPATKRKVAVACADAFVQLQTLPTMHELNREKNLLVQLRDVKVDDLYGEQPVRVELSSNSWLATRRVMIIGSGTVGRQLARSAIDRGVDRVVLVDRADDALRAADRQLRRALGFGQVFTRHCSNIDATALLETAEDHACDVVLYASAGWHSVNTDRARDRDVIRGLRKFVLGLEKSRTITHFAWISHSDVSIPNTRSRALEAIAELIVTAERHDVQRSINPVIRCAVRTPTLYTSGTSIIRDFNNDLDCGLPLTVPSRSAVSRFLHAYTAAELILNAADMAVPHEVFGIDVGEEIELIELAQLMIRLRGMVGNEEIGIHVDPELTVAGTPRPAGAATESDGLVSLGSMAARDDLCSELDELLRGKLDDEDLIAFARIHSEQAVRSSAQAALNRIPKLSSAFA